MDDLPELAALARQTFRETFGHLYSKEDLKSHLATKCSQAYFREAMYDPDNHIVVAWDGERAVAYVKWGKLELPQPDAPTGSREIHRLYVDARYQGKKLGRALFEHALQACANAPAVYLGVWEHNEKAQTFYASYGFEHAGEHTYYVGTSADRDLIWVRHA